MTRNLFEGIPDEAINHGFSQRRPIRSVQIPPELGKSPTDFTDIHRFFLGRFFVTQISQMTQIFSHGIFFIGWHGIYSEVFLRRRLLTDFRGGDLSGRCRYPLSLEKVPQISQIYTDFFIGVFWSRRFRRWRRFFYSSDDTEFIRRFPDEAITHGFSRRRPGRSVQIPPEVGKSPTKKNLCISVKSVGQNNPHKEKSVYICEICGTK